MTNPLKLAAEARELNKREIFEYCLHKLLDRYREKALKELVMQKHGEDVDLEWTLEEACASDFTRQMERLGIICFSESPELDAIMKEGK